MAPLHAACPNRLQYHRDHRGTRFPGYLDRLPRHRKTDRLPTRLEGSSKKRLPLRPRGHLQHYVHQLNGRTIVSDGCEVASGYDSE